MCHPSYISERLYITMFLFIEFPCFTTRFSLGPYILLTKLITMKLSFQFICLALCIFLYLLKYLTVFPNITPVLEVYKDNYMKSFWYYTDKILSTLNRLARIMGRKTFYSFAFVNCTSCFRDKTIIKTHFISIPALPCHVLFWITHNAPH